MGRAPAFGAQQGGFSQPGSAGPQLAPNYGPAQNQAVLDQFEALTLGPAAPGQSGDTGKPSISAFQPQHGSRFALQQLVGMLV